MSGNAMDGSISGWLQQLQAGDAATIESLWLKFFDRLVNVSNQHLRTMSTMLVDGEDVAASVFHSIWTGDKLPRFRQVQSLDEVWWLLVAMAKCKCVDHVRREHALKRGDGKVVSLDGDPASFFKQIVSAEPDPNYVVTFNEEYFRLLELLSDPKQREITVLRVEGHTVEEIAERLGLSAATVNRKLRIVRQVWKDELHHESAIEP